MVQSIISPGFKKQFHHKIFLQGRKVKKLKYVFKLIFYDCLLNLNDSDFQHLLTFKCFEKKNNPIVIPFWPDPPINSETTFTYES